ncbi:MAG: hypothetical protein KDI13_06745 [Alphaproteobacteria bacterium]|nr:hypothetical protein [Alphaproteobacteria bacterium]
MAVFLFDLDGTLCPYDEPYLVACEKAVEDTRFLKFFFTEACVHDAIYARLYGLHGSLRLRDKSSRKRLEKALSKLTTDFV